jgi:hypothetical protein
MSHRTEAWIYISEPDGQQKIVSPSYILNLIGLASYPEFKKDVQDRLWKIEARLRELEAPERRKGLTTFLEEEAKPRTWECIRKRTWADYTDLIALREEGLIIETKSGSHTLFRAEEKEAPT